MKVVTHKGFPIPAGTIVATASLFYKIDGGVLVCQGLDADSDDWNVSEYESIEDLSRDVSLTYMPKNTEVYMPKAGEECEYRLVEKGEYRKVFYIGLNRSGEHVMDDDLGDLLQFSPCYFRPIKTDREEVVEWAMCEWEEGNHGKVLLGRLYDLGALKIPTNVEQ
jgi:hypothetical protein